ncbi:EAL domain protein, partial [Vibrio parahaemolyticus V-223/04]
SVEYR